MCLVLQPGMAFKHQAPTRPWESDDTFICIANLRWAVLAWPLIRCQDQEAMTLDPNGKLHWCCVLRPDLFQAAVAEPSLSRNQIVLSLPEWQPAVKVLLQSSKSDLLVHRDLCFLADVHFGVEKPGGMNRAEILKAIAFEVGGSDLVDQVSSQEAQKSKTKLDDDDPADDLAQLLLESMDKAELDDFKGLKEQLEKKRRTKKSSQWQAWRREAEVSRRNQRSS